MKGGLGILEMWTHDIHDDLFSDYFTEINTHVFTVNFSDVAWICRFKMEFPLSFEFRYGNQTFFPFVLYASRKIGKNRMNTVLYGNKLDCEAKWIKESDVFVVSFKNRSFKGKNLWIAVITVNKISNGYCEHRTNEWNWFLGSSLRYWDPAWSVHRPEQETLLSWGVWFLDLCLLS